MDVSTQLLSFQTPLTLPPANTTTSSLSLIIETKLQRFILESGNTEMALVTSYCLEEESELKTILSTLFFIELRTSKAEGCQRSLMTVLDVNVDSPLYGPHCLAALAASTGLAHSQTPHLQALVADCNRSIKAYVDVMTPILSRSRAVIDNPTPDGRDRDHWETERLALLLALGAENLWETETLAEECRGLLSALTRQLMSAS